MSRVTEIFFRQVPNHVRLPNQRQADRTKATFYDTNGFPNVVGCIQGTQIRNQAPSENEYEFINMKGYHSIKVQLSYHLCEPLCRPISVEYYYFFLFHYKLINMYSLYIINNN